MNNYVISSALYAKPVQALVVSVHFVAKKLTIIFFRLAAAQNLRNMDICRLRCWNKIVVQSLLNFLQDYKSG